MWHQYSKCYLNVQKSTTFVTISQHVVMEEFYRKEQTQ